MKVAASARKTEDRRKKDHPISLKISITPETENDRGVIRNILDLSKGVMKRGTFTMVTIDPDEGETEIELLFQRGENLT